MSRGDVHEISSVTWIFHYQGVLGFKCLPFLNKCSNKLFIMLTKISHEQKNLSFKFQVSIFNFQIAKFKFRIWVHEGLVSSPIQAEWSDPGAINGHGRGHGGIMMLVVHCSPSRTVQISNFKFRFKIS